LATIADAKTGAKEFPQSFYRRFELRYILMLLMVDHTGTTIKLLIKNAVQGPVFKTSFSQSNA
jgi:hypothetical protein